MDAIMNIKLETLLPDVWKIGGEDRTFMIQTDLEDKTTLFDLGVYADPENEPTVLYLKDHIEDILAGKDPEMQPSSITLCSCFGGPITIMLEFKCSERLKVMGVDDFFLLNPRLDDPSFDVIVFQGNDPLNIFTVGYTQDKQDPFVESLGPNGICTTVIKYGESERPDFLKTLDE